ncbi:NYN domain-containing protein [Thauera butanivorans]|uniref:NYN domain-containing protein n=1 Tax=Thauera butanivorans TaxID=86174 RepID=UPI000A037FD2|nr:NYN domain-containing protein [Thauera butanivorans]
MTSQTSDKLAVLIDADNAQASIAPELLAEISQYGTATVKRAYGDWTTQNLVGWKETLHNHAIQPVQQFRFTVGKNATDSALIIDAMDLLHSGTVDGFCLVSSDSDFTRLATRIREAGFSVYGFGEKKTPRPFVAACDKFVFTEILRPQVKDIESASPPASEEPLQPLLTSAINGAAREDRWAALSAVGSLIMKANPSFDPRNYGYQKLGELVRAQTYLETKSIPVGDGSPNVHIYVRRKNG